MGVGASASALVQYLVGMRVDLPRRELLLQPHLPLGWPGWRTGWLELPQQGALRLCMERAGGRLRLQLQRRGGHDAIRACVDLGGLSGAAVPITAGLDVVGDRADRLRGDVTLAPSGESEPILSGELAWIEAAGGNA